MKKHKKAFIIIACVSVVLVVLIAFFGYPVFERYIYTGDRITLNVTASIDGKAYNIKENEIACSFEKNKEQVHCNGQSFSVRANEYGIYMFKIHTKEADVNVSLAHTNWFEINIASLSFNMDTKSKKLTYIIEGERGSLKPESNSKSYNLYHMF